MSPYSYSDDNERLSLLHQVVLQCQVDHLEYCWKLDLDSLSDIDLDIDPADSDDEDEFGGFSPVDLGWEALEPGAPLVLDDELEDWIAKLLDEPMIDF